MATQGTAVVNFGAWPGTTHATVAVTGQGAITGASLVEAWLFPGSGTAEHSSDEHVMAKAMLDVIASDLVAGTGFTIHIVARHQGGEALAFAVPNDTGLASATVGQNTRTPQGVTPSVGGTDLNLHYGTYNVAWVWN